MYDVPYSSNFILKEDENTKRKQFLLASQNYGTFYAVYCKFHYLNGSSKIESVSFEIINYKGLFNIGFLDSSSNSNKIALERKGDELVMGIPLCALTGIESTNLDSKDFVGGKPIETTGIKKFVIYRGLQRFNGPTLLGGEKFFDQEFNYRDGSNTVYARKNPDGLWINDPNEIKTMWDLEFSRSGISEDFFQTVASSGNCRTSYLKPI
jgi:hypothetical protein